MVSVFYSSAAESTSDDSWPQMSGGNVQLLQRVAEKFQQFIQVCLFPVPQAACSPCLSFHLLSGQQMSHCFCKLFLPFPASLKWEEWEKQIWSKAKIKWLQRRERLWTYNNHCRRGGTRTGNQAHSSSAELLSKQGIPTEVSFTLPHVTSLYTGTHSSLTATSPCLFFHGKLSVFPSLGFSDFCCNWFTQWLHTTEPNLSHSWAPECSVKYFVKANRQISGLFLFH